MELRKCINGHYYDASIYTTCPYCETKKQCINGHYYDASIYTTCPYCEQEKTEPLDPPPGTKTGEEITIPIVPWNPVVGWLVCLNNSQKGKDYRIHSDNNYIGRSDKMDVCIKIDETISRDNHAIVSYDRKDNVFYFLPGTGRNIVRVNDNAVFKTIELKAYDVITIGKTNLLFVPLCTEKFKWNVE